MLRKRVLLLCLNFDLVCCGCVCFCSVCVVSARTLLFSQCEVAHLQHGSCPSSSCMPEFHLSLSFVFLFCLFSHFPTVFPSTLFTFILQLSSPLSFPSPPLLSLPDAKHRAECELGPHTRPRSNTLPKSFGSTLDHGTHDESGSVKAQRPTREETLELIQRTVKGKRQEDGWPDDIKVSSMDHKSCSLHRMI